MSGGGAQNPKKKQEIQNRQKEMPPRRGQLEAQKERKKNTRKVESEDKRENRDLYLPSS